jgi:hypothetical protein
MGIRASAFCQASIVARFSSKLLCSTCQAGKIDFPSKKMRQDLKKVGNTVPSRQALSYRYNSGLAIKLQE